MNLMHRLPTNLMMQHVIALRVQKLPDQTRPKGPLLVGTIVCVRQRKVKER